ncbi:hypothetical protein KKH23_05470 [Patescibacteria group bacterium]|nr:hypothetical protein [Patescibacteria group bacterium]
MKMYEVETMDEKTMIPAENRKEAYAKFFINVKLGKHPLNKIGGLISVRDPDDGEDYPFRTTPTLWLMKIITPETAFATIEKMLDLDPSSEDSAKLLLQSAKQDMWILDEIKRLEAEG